MDTSYSPICFVAKAVLRGSLAMIQARNVNIVLTIVKHALIMDHASPVIVATLEYFKTQQ